MSKELYDIELRHIRGRVGACTLFPGTSAERDRYDLLGHVDAQDARIAELEAIVEALPKDGQGNPIIDGKTYYVCFSDKGQEWVEEVEAVMAYFDGPFDETPPLAELRDVVATRLWHTYYPTAEAAKAAKEK